VTIYCPRGPFCAFAHIERMFSTREIRFEHFIFVEELKSYRDFDLHYTNELPLSSFIPIPEEKEVGILNVRSRRRKNNNNNTNEKYIFCLDITNKSKHSEKVFSTIGFRSWIISWHYDETI